MQFIRKILSSGIRRPNREAVIRLWGAIYFLTSYVFMTWYFNTRTVVGSTKPCQCAISQYFHHELGLNPSKTEVKW
jgi:hypothetical protein